MPGHMCSDTAVHVFFKRLMPMAECYSGDFVICLSKQRVLVLVIEFEKHTAECAVSCFRGIFWVQVPSRVALHGFWLLSDVSSKDGYASRL